MNKTTNFKDTLRFYFSVTWKYPRNFLLVFLNSFQTIANAVLTPLMIGLAIQKLQDPDSISLSFGTMIGIIIAWSIAAILFHRIAMRNLNTLEVNGVKDIYRIIANHLMNESYSFHAKSFSGALLNQSSKLAQGYIMFMDTALIDTQRNFVIVVVSSIVLAFYDPLLALLTLTLSAIGILTAVIMASKRFPYRKKAVKATTKQTAFLADIITNAITVKAFASEDQEKKELDKYLDKTGRYMHQSWNMAILANNFMTAVAVLMNISILLYGINATNSGALGLGVFIAAQIYAVRITGSFWDLTRIIRSFETVLADAHEMTAILKEEPSVLDAPNAKELAVNKGEIKLNKVTFRYEDSEADDNVFEDMTLTVKPGERVGLVGHSGGGKTTITKLLLRFVDIQDGSIEIDGQDIAKVTQGSLRNQIAYVPQEPMLFHRSINDNIRYARPEASDEEVIKAAQLANADEFIQSLPHKYDTEVGERGVKLSGGQRQRIAIARAILKDAPILVLDEATSALDSKSEKLIQASLTDVMKGRTTIVVAHRLSTIQKLDRIVVIENGKITEQGSHAELTAKNGIYAKLWDHQSGGFIEE